MCHDKWSCTEFVTDLVFMLEILISFNTSYFNKRTLEYETSRCKISKRYLTSWFAIDVMTVMPRFFSMVSMNSDDNSERGQEHLLSLMKFARISRIAKLLRLFKIFKATGNSGNNNGA